MPEFGRERWSGGKKLALNRHFCRHADPAAEMLEHFSGVLQDRSLFHCLRALVSRRHLAGSIQGVCRPDVQLAS